MIFGLLCGNAAIMYIDRTNMSVDLGARIALLSNHNRMVVALDRYGLNITEQVPIENAALPYWSFSG
jgi:hypothetical protein